MKNRSIVLEKRLFIAILIVVIITGALTITSLSRSASNATSILCTFVNSYANSDPTTTDTTPTQYMAILHYATTRTIPQQTISEITVTFDLLRSISPCNFLVFGLGHDSLMWSSFNPRGTTLFLEEDIRWVHQIINEIPTLRVHDVQYTTHLSDADDLLSSYKFVPQCMPPHVTLRGNTKCRLALSDLPDEAYEKDWDVIMIDGPRGYYAEAPGRMSVIFSAAVMARARTRPGVTHVLVHDVHRKVEKNYAEEFLCMKYMVKAEGRLWHFEIPPAAKLNGRFC
ncbi:hypothetical protein LguiB_011466 [Lonicera macranthoides]